MTKFTVIKQTKTYTEIVEQITNLIKTGALKPGEKLPSERVLAQELGIGRQSLREAFSVLEASGVLEVRPGRGTYVREDGLANTENLLIGYSEFDRPFELMEARRIIEPQTARLAAERAEDAEIAEMEQLVKRMEEMAGLGGHPSAEDKKLHLLIAKASRNVVLQKTMNLIVESMGEKLWLTLKEQSLTVPGRNERYQREHRELLEAIRRRDSEEAAAVMLKHLAGIEEDLLETEATEQD
ncbi:MAG: FadR family transcriptional regulator [Negativicutes bacterium]|nr:FadR family transcriptional regulator [Negativicutes bacterium]